MIGLFSMPAISIQNMNRVPCASVCTVALFDTLTKTLDSMHDEFVMLLSDARVADGVAYNMAHLPDVDGIDEYDEGFIVYVRSAYDDLTSRQQSMISEDLVNRLSDCEKAVEEAKKDAVDAANREADERDKELEDARKLGHDKGFEDGFAEGQENARAEAMDSGISLDSLSEQFDTETDETEDTEQNDNVMPIESNFVFDLEHAKRVNDYNWDDYNAHLRWQGNDLGYSGGYIGCYTEAINVLWNKDYRIHDIYDRLIADNPTWTEKNNEPWTSMASNDYYHIKAEHCSRTIDAILEALNQGKVVQFSSTANKWRDHNHNLKHWPGHHSGLIFYFDGENFHMKDTGSGHEADALYTAEELESWLSGFDGGGIAYSRCEV